MRMETTNHPLQVWIDTNDGSLGQLATDVNCSVPHLRNIIAGRRGASIAQAKRLHEVTGLPMDTFIATIPRQVA